MGAAAILTIYPAVLVAAVLTLGSTGSGTEMIALLFAGGLAAIGLLGIITMSRQAREPGDP